MCYPHQEVGHLEVISKIINFQLTEIISDRDGRYIIAAGLLESRKMILVNIYAPNYGQAHFLSTLMILLAKFKDDPMITGGNFNSVSYPTLDRSNRPLPTDNALSASFNELQQMLGLTDAWRCVNPVSRKYTFYSEVHNTYSRIDYLLLSNFPIHNMISS